MRGLARSLLFDEHQVDDLVQQTWLLALRQPVARLSEGSPRGWLATVVRNLVRNTRRADARREYHEREASATEGLPSTDELLAQHDVKRKVVELVGALPEPYRATILLRYFECLAPRQIAAQTGVPKATVAVRLKRGLQMLRDRLDVQHGGDRRQWCLALVPIAASSRATVGVLAGKATTWLGVWMMMKSTLLTLSVLVCLLAIALGYYWSRDLGVPSTVPVGTVVVPKVVVIKGADARASQVPNSEDESRALLTTKTELVPEDSVLAALSGFRGRLLRPDGIPAVAAAVRILSIDPLTMFGADAAPMAKAAENFGPQFAETKCDGDGRFLVTGIWPQGMHALHAGIAAEASLLKMIERSPGPGQIIDLGTLSTVQKAVIEGVVVGDEGEPLANAEVWAADIPGAVLAVAPVDRLTADGAVFMSMPSLGPEQLPEADAEAFHQRLRSHLGRTVVQSGGDADFVVMDLPLWAQRFLDHLPRARCRTDAEGRFRLLGVEPGDNVLVVRAKGYANGGKARVPVRVDRVRRLGKIRMRRGNSIRGVVLDAAGKPVGGAELRAAFRPAIGLTGILFADETVRADSQGQFEVPDLPRGQAVLALRRDVDSAWHVVGQYATDEEELELELPNRVTLSLSVSSASGDAIENVQFEIQDGPPLGEFARTGLLRRRGLKGLTAAGVPGLYRLPDLENGVYTVFARADGYAMACHVVRIGGEDLESRLVLVAKARLNLEVVDSAGMPVAGARVYAMHEDVPAWSRSYLFRYAGIDGWDRMPLLLGHTDIAGQLTSENLAAGKVSLLIRHPAFGVADAICELPGDLRIELETPGLIFGQLFDHGVPALSKKHRLTAVRQREGRGAAPEIAVQASVGEDGRFRFEGLAPGNYVVSRVNSIGDVRSLGSWVERLKPYWMLFEERREERVIVRSGEEHELVFDVDENRDPDTAGLQFSGSVRINGQAVEGYSWSENGQELGRFAKIDGNGAFLVRGLKSKVIPLSLASTSVPGRILWEGRIDLTKGDDIVLNLDLEMAALRGRVIGFDGKPAARHRYRLEGGALALGGAGIYSGVTGAEGQIDLAIPQGSYVLSIRGPKGILGVPSLVIPVGGADGLKWKLGRKNLISGRVGLNGAPTKVAAWIRLKAHGEPSGVNEFQEIEKGIFYFSDKPAGEYELTIMDDDFNRYACRPRIVKLEEKGLVDLVLQLGPRLK